MKEIEIKVMNDKELTMFSRRNWYRIAQPKRLEIVTMLRNELPMESFREEMDADPYGWCVKNMWHFSQGMGIRNLLRQKGFSDDQLPPVKYENGLEDARNWDDAYTAALEAAAGVIEI